MGVLVSVRGPRQHHGEDRAGHDHHIGDQPDDGFHG